MEFEQKAEEKKMSMSKNIARLAVTAGLTAALSFGGVMAPVTMAFAAEGATATANGSVKIANVKDNHTEFYGYHIFTADVKDGKVSNITWANEEVEAAVKSIIKTVEPSYAVTTAQDAADWITNQVKGTSDTFRVGPDNVAYKIAAAVDNLTEQKTTTNGVASGLEHGYWLFVTKADTIGDGEAGTSPIFTVVGDTPVEVNEKTGIPTVEKKIVSDADDKERDAADSQIGQNVTYNLYGTIAENYDKYDTYFYQFSDQISKGLTLQDGAEVYLYANKKDAKDDLARTKGTKITDNFVKKASAEADADGNKTTTWTCGDLKKVDGVTKDSCIVVSYKAKINSEATVGDNAGNTNTVKLEYSNNPMTNDYGTTVPDEVKTYTYGLKLNKVDLGTENALPKAKFTIKVKTAADSSLMGKYVQSDGTLGDDAYKFTTGDDGAFAVTGLGAGTYTVEETGAPENYDKVAPFDFTIKSKSESGTSGESSDAEKYVLSASSNQVIIGTPNNKKGDNKLEAEADTATNNDGTFNITVGDTKHVGLPLTGLNGVTFTWIAGGAVLCIGVAHLIRSRKQAEESEQE